MSTEEGMEEIMNDWSTMDDHAYVATVVTTEEVPYNEVSFLNTSTDDDETDILKINPTPERIEDIILGKKIPHELKSILELSKEAKIDVNMSHKRKSVEPTKSQEGSENSNSSERAETPERKRKMSRLIQLSEVTEQEDGRSEKDVFLASKQLEKTTMRRRMDSPGGGSTDADKKHRRLPQRHEMSVVKNNKDGFCWICHRNSINLSCETCPRSYHLKCIKVYHVPDIEHWPCPECVAILTAENTKTRSAAMKDVSLEQLCELLKYAHKRMVQVADSEPFMHPVNEADFPDYTSYIVQPMDLTTLAKNIKENNYGSTVAFEADAKWILHNSIIFNTYQSKLTSTAKSVLRICKHEMSEIENCSSCYLNANTKKDWFVEVCPKPHIIIWAKLKGFPYWPAKAMSSNSVGMVDCRFFGAHDRAWVSYKDCYLYCQQDPNSNKQKRHDIIECTKEVEIYIQNLKKVYMNFQYAKFKVLYDPGHEMEMLETLIPNYCSPIKLVPKLVLKASAFETEDTKEENVLEEEEQDDDDDDDEDSIKEPTPSPLSHKPSSSEESEDDSSDDDYSSDGIVETSIVKTRRAIISDDDDDESEDSDKAQSVKSNRTMKLTTSQRRRSVLSRISVESPLSVKSRRNSDNDSKAAVEQSDEKVVTKPDKEVVKTPSKISDMLMKKLSEVEESKTTDDESQAGEENEAKKSEVVVESEKKEDDKTDNNVEVKKDEIVKAVSESDSGSLLKCPESVTAKMIEDAEVLTTDEKMDEKEDQTSSAVEVSDSLTNKGEFDSSTQVDATEMEITPEEIATTKESNSTKDSEPVKENTLPAPTETTLEESKKEEESNTKKSDVVIEKLGTSEEVLLEKLPISTENSLSLVPIANLETKPKDKDEAIKNEPAVVIIKKTTKTVKTVPILKKMENMVSIFPATSFSSKKRKKSSESSSNDAAEKPVKKLVTSDMVANSPKPDDKEDKEKEKENARNGYESIQSILERKGRLKTQPTPPPTVITQKTIEKSSQVVITKANSTTSETKKTPVEENSSDMMTDVKSEPVSDVDEDMEDMDEDDYSENEYMEAKLQYLSALNISEKRPEKKVEKNKPIRTRSKTEEMTKHKTDGTRPGMNKIIDSVVSHFKENSEKVSTRSKDFKKQVDNHPQSHFRQFTLKELLDDNDSFCKSDEISIHKKRDPSSIKTFPSSATLKQRARKSFPRPLTSSLNSNSVSLIKQKPSTNSPKTSTNSTKSISNSDATTVRTASPRISVAPPSTLLANSNSGSTNTSSNNNSGMVVMTQSGAVPVTNNSGYNSNSSFVMVQNPLTYANANYLMPQAGTPFQTVPPLTAIQATISEDMDTRNMPSTSGTNRVYRDNVGDNGEDPNEESGDENGPPSDQPPPEFNLLNGLVPDNITKAVSDLFCKRAPPKLKPRPPGPLSQQFASGVSSEAGMVTSRVNSVAHRFTDYFRGMLIETLADLGTDNNEAVIASLRLENEALKHKHAEEILEIKKNVNSLLCDIQKSIIEEKDRIIDDTKGQCEVESIRRINETKSKQWCANCLKEAQFYCCWNTSYCDYPCQSKHWAKHQHKCTQDQNSNAPSTAPSAGSSKNQLVLRQSAPPPKGFTGKILTAKGKVLVNRGGNTAKIPMNVLRRASNGGHITLIESTPGNYELVGNGPITPISVAGYTKNPNAIISKLKSSSSSSSSGGSSKTTTASSGGAVTNPTTSTKTIIINKQQPTTAALKSGSSSSSPSSSRLVNSKSSPKPAVSLTSKTTSSGMVGLD